MSRRAARAAQNLEKALSRTSQQRPYLRLITSRATSQHARIPTTPSRAFSTSASPRHGHSSVDPSEVSHFNNLASSWWDPHGPSRILHLMNQLRHPFIQRCLSSQPTAPPPRLRYLDVGCGGGIFAESAARQRTTQSVLGIDPTPEVLAVAEAHKRQDPLLTEPGRLTYKNIAVEQLPQPATPHDGFDVVSCFEVIEHVSMPAVFLQTLMPHVRPGGWLVMSTIARTWTSWATTNLIAEDILGIVPRGTHDWNKYINKEELSGWFLKQEGWERPTVMGVMYIPGFGWKEVKGSEDWGNYFFAVRRKEAS
ncbi:hexaprenyldihydroxybenzoate methyltransferase mitochondrial precursor [Phyllosticta citricarpa]|uniref:Ubiquinone biosynthesis O-methyltransferase, mitochondrial n=1 Tax=Phyllosticta paracitricarpa TaxID=2016321 RepID=A0ABR1N9Y5_9PEZI